MSATTAANCETSYGGYHAALYDLFYADKPYAQEAAFVHGLLQRHAQGSATSLLELACGTGNHAFPFEKLGYRVLATDYSKDMLQQAQAKRSKANSAVEFRQEDMCKLPTPARPFDAVVCLFNSIGYLTTNEQLAAALAGVQRNLRPGGLFVFEFWHAPAMLRHFEPLRVRKLARADAEILRLSETTLDYAHNTADVSYSIFEMRHDGTYHSLRETQRNRYFSIPEMAGLITNAGLTPLKWFDGYRDSEAVGDGTWHVLALARRP